MTENIIMKKVLITGANGFVGSALVEAMVMQNMNPVAAIRKNPNDISDSVECFEVGDLSPRQDWSLPLKNIDSLVHCAAKVHVMENESAEAMDIYRRVNTDSTLNLARQAAKAGLKRFVFLSTIKANGESTNGRVPFSEKDDCQPSDPYAISKYEAETGLMEIAKKTGMEVVIIRPPLVYGPGVKGNLASMMRWVKKGIPLPLGAIKNQRSLIALDNLVEFISLCLKHPKAKNEIFLVSDGEDVSTTQLVKKLAHAHGKKARLMPVPVNLIKTATGLLGKNDVVERLFGSLQVNCTKAQEVLDWKASVTMDEQLKKMTQRIK